MPHEIIKFGDENDFIKIRCVEYGTVPGMSDGDLRLEISVRAGDFTGKNDVWIANNEWSRFITSLFQFERQRQGQATLHAMSPGEFELHLQCVGHIGGQVIAHGHLGCYHNFNHPSGHTVQSRVQYCAYIDPSMLREIVETFKAIGNDTASSET